MSSALEKERDYYKNSFLMAANVIKQLYYGVKAGEPEYIHPFDLYDILNKMDISTLVEYIQNPDSWETDKVCIAGKVYVQTTIIPAKNNHLV